MEVIEVESRNRNVSIDIMKVLAVLTVMNSHMDICYGDYALLATGGAIGDGLFFFCSGFTMLLGSVKSFPNYYKKRIARIYPTIIVISIIATTVFSRLQNIVDDVVFGGGWFVKCIMIYYVVLWFVKKYFMNSFRWLWFTFAVVIVMSYYFVFHDESFEFFLYHNTHFKWVFFILFMLYGGYVGSHQRQFKYSVWCIPKLIGCLLLWYSFFVFSARFQFLIDFQYLSIIPLLGIIHYIYICCNHPKLIKIAKHKVYGQIIFIVGGVCLEAYLIQMYLFSDRLNYLFPLNIPIMMIYVLVTAYGVNFLSNVLSQIFKTEDFSLEKLYLHK